MEGTGPDRRGLRTVACVTLIVAITAATHAWMLDYPLVLDDYSRLAEAESFDRTDFLLGGVREPHTVFRPVLWATQRLDHVLWGWWIPGHHISSIAWHALTCVLLWAVMSELLSRRSRFAALIVALLFCVHPAKLEAVAWIAARGSILPATFGLMAAWLQIRRRKGAAIPLAFPIAALVCAFLSKESAVGLAAAVLAIDLLLVPAAERRRARGLDVAVLAALPFLLWGARRLLLGDDATRYLGWYLELDATTLLETLRSLPRLATGFLGGIAPGPGTSLSAVIPVATWIATLGACVLIPWSKNAWRWALALVAAFVAVATPTAFVARVVSFENGEHAFASRLVYPAGVVLCAFAAAPFAAAHRAQWRRVGVVVYAVVLVCGLGHAWWRNHERFEDRIRVERALRDALAEAVADSPGTVVAVEGLPGWLEGLAWDNFHPPFHPRTVRLRTFRRSRIEELHALLDLDVPVKLARWRDRVLDVSGRAAPPAPFVEFSSAEATPAARVSLPAIEPRAMKALAIDVVLEGGGGASLFDVVVVDENDRELVIRSGRDPAFARDRALVVALDDHVEILEFEPVVAVEIRHRSGPAARIAATRTLKRLPAIELEGPADAAVIASESPDLILRFRDPGGHPIIRLGFRLGDHVWSTIVWRAGLAESDDGTLTVRMDTPDALRGGGGPTIRTLLSELGVERLDVAWWVDGLDGQIFHRSARSPVRRLTVVR